MGSMYDLLMTFIHPNEDTCQKTPSGMTYLDCSTQQSKGWPGTWNKIVRLWTPSLCLLSITLLHVLFLVTRSKKTRILMESKTFMKTFIALALTALTLVQIQYIEDFDLTFENLQGDILAKVIEAGLFVMVAALVVTERSHASARKCFPLFAFWTLMLVWAFLNLLPPLLSAWHSEIKIEMLIDAARLLGVFIEFFMSLLPEATQEEGDKETPKSDHPEDNASWLANITMSWTTCVVRSGFKKTLEETDVPELAPSDMCINVVPRLERVWQQEELRSKFIEQGQTSLGNIDKVNEEYKDGTDTSLLDKSDGIPKKEDDKKIKGKNSLLRALVRSYGTHFFSLQIIKALMEMTDFIEPLLTAVLMNFIQNRQNESTHYGLFIVFSIFILKSLSEMAHHRIWYSINRLSRHMKNSVKMIIFQKSMSMNNECQKDKTNGEIVSLMSEHCSRVFEMGHQIFFIFMTPLKIVTALYLLYTYLGWSMLIGFVIMLVLIPVNVIIGKRLKDASNTRNKVKDDRIKLMNEVISGIKVLKLYAWENSFKNKVRDIRSQELDSCKQLSIYRACVDSIFRAIPFLVKVCAFGTFLLIGGHLDATKGFVAIHLFHTLNHPLSLMAILMPRYVDALVSLRRINEFLNGEDISSAAVTKVTKTTSDGSAISVKGGSFSWEKFSVNPTLMDIEVAIPTGGLVAVVGMVGSGKSSLLSSFLGEMEKLDGSVDIQGSIAYVPQEAWILNASLQDNVLFGAEKDDRWYRRVVSGCSLKNDINLMGAGDRTEIGEKGINLSGGQKQRVSLARAVYNNADVYLLDDPLSAVDAHVGKHIFNKVIGHGGILKRKTRVLVTHGVHWLPFVDSILVMKDGQISENGSYDELIARDGDFAQFLRNMCSQSLDNDVVEVKTLKKNIFKRLNSRDSQEEAHFAREEEQSRAFFSDVISESEISPTDEENEDALTVDDDIEERDASGRLIDEEEMEHGAVKKGVYLDYLRAIGFRSVGLFVFIYFVTIVASNCNSFVVKVWTDDPVLANSSLSQTEEFTERSWHHFHLFCISGLIEVVSAFLFILLTLQGAFKAATKIHNDLLDTILRCPMSFFDTTPSARIVNRFSTDIARVDGLSGYLRGYIERFFMMSISLFLIVINAPNILYFLTPVGGAYYLLHLIHISTVRQLRRFRSKHQSPMSVHFSETLTGVVSIRAYSCKERFTQAMEQKIDKWSNYDNMELAVALWFGMRMAFLYLFIQMLSGFIVVMDTNMTAGMAGLVLMFAGEFSGNLSALIHMVTHMEMEIVSLERVLDYAQKPTEAAWEIPGKKSSADWPSDGRVVLNELKARYRDGLDLVLKGVNCDIKHGEKIGIVGRTGAGKSSLTVALFRLVEAASGHILVDNQKTADLGLHDLRNSITILPQDPVIFAGTLRMNLDPFNKSTTQELWRALEHSHLRQFVEGLPGKLDFECGEGGKNLSVGQRQLLCLARTLLRQTKILVLDEATAAVDMETDELIQKTIRTEFKECTVLAIAHRLNTIMDYDRILVMEAGVVREFDSPSNLLANKQSAFYSMAKDAQLVR